MSTPPDISLACNWSKSRVQECLDKGKRWELVRFLRDRYTERFFNPIGYLTSAPANHHGYGFAVMSLCCLLIETLECYLEGLPSTSRDDLAAYKKLQGATCPLDYQLAEPFQNRSRAAFVDFFKRPSVERFLPQVNGEVFFDYIRCGLLHQAQTKFGWRIRKEGTYWDEAAKLLGRDEFASRLEDYFHSFLTDLENASTWTNDPWKSAGKKIYWLVQTS